ncbi:MAG: response regulator [Verrucomicrobiae bacterium]|nr:response regulator [Verrucomicrobiae bacterium]
MNSLPSPVALARPSSRLSPRTHAQEVPPLLARILLIDDSAMYRKVMFKVFHIFHCQIIEAANGQDGLDAARKIRPTLVILDINMPVLDGEGCLRALKADPALADIPVIMLSANEDQETISKFKALGACEFLKKSLNSWEMIDKVRRFVPLSHMINI